MHCISVDLRDRPRRARRISARSGGARADRLKRKKVSVDTTQTQVPTQTLARRRPSCQPPAEQSRARDYVSSIQRERAGTPAYAACATTRRVRCDRAGRREGEQAAPSSSTSTSYRHTVALCHTGIVGAAGPGMVTWSTIFDSCPACGPVGRAGEWGAVGPGGRAATREHHAASERERERATRPADPSERASERARPVSRPVGRAVGQARGLRSGERESERARERASERARERANEPHDSERSVGRPVGLSGGRS